MFQWRSIHIRALKEKCVQGRRRRVVGVSRESGINWISGNTYSQYLFLRLYAAAILFFLAFHFSGKKFVPPLFGVELRHWSNNYKAPASSMAGS